MKKWFIIYTRNKDDIYIFFYKESSSCTGFQCDDGDCIPESWKCNAFVDCSNGEDEDPALCGKKKNKKSNCNALTVIVCIISKIVRLQPNVSKQFLFAKANKKKNKINK